LRSAFIAGSTGYLGTRLAQRLLEKGYTVEALVRKESEHKAPPGCEIITGNPLAPKEYQNSITADTFIHLIGVPNPSPAKADLFRQIDLPAAVASIEAATQADVKHFIYVSVAHPAPVMRAYVQTRIEAEARLRESGLNATILRPWYVLGPGHRWAYALIPFYKLFEFIPATRSGALRCGLVTLPEMLCALIHAVEHPAKGIRIIEVPEIRSLLKSGSG
jgi:uncharacterized protein YbjT (DUF2867 family)